MLPADYSIIAGQVLEGGSDVYSGRSVGELRRDYIEIIRFFLQNGARANVSSDFNSDNIPLLLAAKNRDIEIIKLLLDFKADPNISDDMGMTALHVLGEPVAVPFPYKDAPEIATLLISKGAKMTKVHLTGETPMAIVKSRLNIIQSPEASYWRDVPFYNELVSSFKALSEIYSK
jgi:ankyrin repeat protein